jgi:small neutral amino acid transporter SnatA (MarC family)
MNYELSWGDIGILFFLTLGPLKAILPFARVTRGTELAFRRTVALRAVTIATVIVLAVALLGPLVLTNWHVSPPAIAITCGIILFYQALQIIMQTPAPPGSADRQPGPVPPSPATAVFPLAIPAIVSAPGIAALAAVSILYRHDLAHQGDRCCIVARSDGAQPAHFVEHRGNSQARLGRGIAGRRLGIGRASGLASGADHDL